MERVTWPSLVWAKPMTKKEPNLSLSPFINLNRYLPLEAAGKE